MLEQVSIIDRLEKWCVVNDILYVRCDISSNSSDPQNYYHGISDAIPQETKIWCAWVSYEDEPDTVSFRYRKMLEDGSSTVVVERDLSYDDVVKILKRLYETSAILENRPWAIPED